MVLSDEPWRDIGFSKRPRYGKFFQRFRARWKTDLEKRTLQEMLAAFTAAYVVAGRVSSDKVLSIVGAYTARADILTALGYSSREEGVRDLGSPLGVDAGLWPARGPHADARLRVDARGRDGGVREESAKG